MPDRGHPSSEQSELWVGTHPKLGLVLYDKRSQIGVPPGFVRLFVVAESRMGKFKRDIARSGLA